MDALACEVAGKKKPGRLSADERIVAIVQGVAVGDVAFAIYALREAERLNKGLAVTLPG
jgi:ornithine cyclodeaminase/alanine dehydrogenase-like protein (mu-crystallin family)